MFKFSLFDKFRQKGISLDIIPPELRNRFLAHFGTINEEISPLNDRLQVRFDEKAIRFFFYTGKVNVPVIIDDQYHELAAISLTNVKETGHDILFFGHHVKERIPDFLIPAKDKDKTDTNEENIAKKLRKSIIQFSKNLAGYPDPRRLYGFPFVDKWNRWEESGEESEEENVEEKVKAWFPFFMQCCFLYFILEMEDRSCDFAQSPLYDTVRNKLRESLVYQMLCAKIKYTIRLYEGAAPQSQDEYNFVTQKFVNCLMDKRFNIIIPPHIFTSEQSEWFYDPEQELEAILEINRNQEKKHDHKELKDLQVCLDDSLVLKIRDFFYTKHAIYEANIRVLSKRMFAGAQILMAITSAAILFPSFWMEKTTHILHIAFPIVTTLFCILFAAFLSLKDYKKKQKSSSTTPKWSSLQLHLAIPLLILFLISVLLIIFASIDQEHPIIQHTFYAVVVLCVIFWICCSGYFNNPINSDQENDWHGENDTRDKPVLFFHKIRKMKNGILYALFLRILVAELAAWLTIGITEDLVKSMLWVNEKKVIAFVLVTFFVFLILVGEAKQHSPYKDIFRNLLVKKVPLIVNHALFFALVIGLSLQLFFYDNLIRNSDVMSNTVFNDYFDDTNYYVQLLDDLGQSAQQYENFYYTAKPKNDSNLIVLHNSIVNHFNSFASELKELKNFDTLNSTITALSPILDTNSITSILIDTNSITSILKSNINTSIQNSKYLQEEISIVRKKLLDYNNYETLMDWVTMGYPETFHSGSDYLDRITQETIQKQQKCCRKVELFDKDRRIFPNLLLFHTLIVLVLAFVTQLLISDKSVTEPL